MKTNYITLSIVFIFLNITLQAQMPVWKSGMANQLEGYQSIKQQSIQASSSFSIGENSEAAQFSKWQWFWDKRAGNANQPSDFETAQKAIMDYIQSGLTTCGSQNTFEPHWNNIGPENFAVAEGRLECVWVKPGNRDIIVAGSNSGGLYKTTDGGMNWHCVTNGLPAMGFNRIVFDPINNQLIAASNMNDLAYGYGVGLILSNDEGETWQLDQAFYTYYQSIENWVLPRINDLKMSPYNNELVVVMDRYVLKRSNNIWQNITPSNSNIEPPGFLYNRNIFFDIEALNASTWALTTVFQIGTTGNSAVNIPGTAQFFITNNNGSTWLEKTTDLSFANEWLIQNGNFENGNLSPFTASTNSSTTVKWEAYTTPAGTSARCWPEAGKYNYIFHYGQKTNYVLCPGSRYTLSFNYTLSAHTKLIIHLSTRTSLISSWTAQQWLTNTNQDYKIEIPSSGFAGNTTTNNYSITLDDILNNQSNYFLSVFFEAVHDETANNGDDYVDIDDINVQCYTLSDIKTERDAFNHLYVQYNRIWSGQYMAKYNIEPSVQFQNTGAITATPALWDFRCSQQTENKIYGMTTTFLLSTNAGLNFNETFPYNTNDNAKAHVDCRNLLILIDDEVEYIYRCDDGGLSYSTDNGYNYTHLNGKGLIITQFYGLSDLELAHLWAYAGAQDNGLYRFKNAVVNRYYVGDGYKPEAYEQDGAVRLYYQSGIGGAHGNSVSISHADQDVPVSGVNVTPSGTNTEPQEFSKPIYTHPYNGKFYAGFANLYYKDLGGVAASYDYYNIIDKTFTIDNNPINKITSFDISDETNQYGYPEFIYVTIDGFIPVSQTQPKDRILKIEHIGPDNTNYTINDITKNLPVDYYTLSSVVSDPKDHNRVWVGLSQFAVTNVQGNNQLNPGHQRIYFRDLSDANGDWVDVSEGLPAFPINCLVYQKGSDDIIYAGTDVGVFVYNKTATRWECFNQNMVCMITGLEINYCTGKLRASTWGRGLWESDIIRASSMQVPYVIEENTNWNSDLSLYFNVTIKPGATLTISNALVNISPGVRITVERGGRLIIDNSTLTNLCGKQWDGIYVEGNALQEQPTIPQAYSAIYPPSGANPDLYSGVLIIKNNSVITHADFAVNNCPSYDWGFDLNKSGGLIIAEDAFFRDNYKNAAFVQYGFTDNSFFKRCQFSVTDYILEHDIPTNELVSLWDVHGTTFLACDFENGTSEFPRYKGIYSVDASYNIMAICEDETNLQPCDPCENMNASTFNSLFYGLYAIGTIPEYPLTPIRVYHSTFFGNERGIFLSGINFTDLKHNDFKIPSSTLFNKCYGLYLEACKQFEVEENIFHSGNNNANAGAYFCTCNLMSNTVYRNTFMRLETGIGAIGNNFIRNKIGKDGGLFFKCNTFEECSRHDIAVFTINPVNGYSYVAGGIPDQGHCENPMYGDPIREPAGNVFSSALWNIFKSTNAIDFDYYHHDAAAYTPVSLSNGVYLNDCYNYSSENIESDCAANTCYRGVQLGKMLSLQGDYQALSELIDGGNKAILQQKIDDPIHHLTH